MTSSSSLYGSVNTQNASSTNSTSLYGEAGTPIPTPTGDLVVRGDLIVLSGNILTTAGTGNIFPANATTINLGLAATAVNIGANTGTTTINNDLTVDGDITATGADFGNITIAVATNNTITTTTGDLVLESATGEIDTGTTDNISTNSTTFRLLNFPTTVNAFLGATSLNIGAGTGTTNINNNLLIDGTSVGLAPATFINYSENNDRLNRPTVKSTTGNTSGWRVNAPNATTSALANISAASSNDNNNNKFIGIQARGATTNDLRIQTGKYTAGVQGASGTVVTFMDYITPYATVNPAGPTNALDLTTKAYVDAIDTNTTYTVDASVATGGANFNLVGSDATTDTIKFASGTNVTISATDANTITIDAADTNTTYTIDASSTTGGANLNLVGSDLTTDTVKISSGTGVTVAQVNANELSVAIGQSVATTDSPTFAGLTSGNITVGLADNNAITTTSGSLVIGSFTDSIGLGSTDTLTTNSTSFNLLNSPLSVSAFQAATAVSLGALTGTTTVRNQLATTNFTFPLADGTSNQIIRTNGSGVLSWYSPSDLNTTYTIDASSTTGGANLNLVGSDATTDTVKFAEGTGIDIVQTDANTITVNSTITQYTDAQARAALSGTSPIGYNTLTGAITFTPTPTGGSLLAGNGTTWVDSITGQTAQYMLNRNSTGATGSNNILSLIKTRTDGARTNGQGPFQIFNYTGTDGGYNFARISTGYQSGGAHTMSFATSTDTTGGFGAGTTTILNLAPNGSLFTSSGATTFVRTGSIAAQPPAQQIRYQRTDVAGAQDGDGVDFRLGVGGSATNVQVARFDCTYKASGDNEIGMSVSADSFTVDTDRIYVGSRAKTQIRNTPVGGGTTNNTAEFTQLATTIKTDSVVLQTAAGVALIGNNISYNRVYGQWQNLNTISPVAPNTAYVFALPTTDFANIASVASTSRIIPGAAGMYKTQFSVQVQNTDNAQDHTAYFWWRKNGTDVSGSMGRVTVPKGNVGGQLIVGWDNMISSANTTDYWELAYAVDDIQVTFPSYVATAFGPATAALFMTLVPVGA